MTIAFPILLIQLWKFIAPGLYKNEKMMFLPFLIATPIFFFRRCMVYYIVIPLAWDFLFHSNYRYRWIFTNRIRTKISEYLSLVMKLIFAFGICFELPVLLLLLTKSGIMTPQDLANKRKYAILISFVVAAILTPPDVISQVLLALPMIALYEFSILLSKFNNKKNK